MNNKSQNSVTFFGRTNFRDSSGHRPKVFGLRQTDRLSHVYLLGKTGVGKSTAMATLLFQDLASGQGVGVLDPHGDLIEQVLTFIPEARKDDVIYFNVPDADHPFAFNPLEKVPSQKKPLAASGLLEAFKKIWDESWGPRTEHILRNAILALLDQPEATLADVLKMLDDSDFRSEVLERVENAQVRRFWLREYKNYTFGIRAMAILPIQNKIGAFLSNPLLHRILVQPRSTFDIRQIMDEGKILLVNLAKGRIGEDTSALLGALLVTKIALAGHGRAEMPEHERRNFFLYVDEFQTFTTLSFANMLSELRKYHVGMILAHQYLAQLEPAVRDAVLGNIGTLVAFRLGAPDAQVLAKEFEPVFEAVDLINLPNYNVYLRLMINGQVSKPFSAEILTPSDLRPAAE